jgi:hypothetical protein
VSVLERSESLTRLKGIDAAPDACKMKSRGGEMGGGVRSMVPGGGGREGTRRCGRDAWSRGVVRAVDRGAVQAEAANSRAVQGRARGEKLGLTHGPHCWAAARPSWAGPKE